jgi:hypothetical protein
MFEFCTQAVGFRGDHFGDQHALDVASGLRAMNQVIHFGKSLKAVCRGLGLAHVWAYEAPSAKGSRRDAVLVVRMAPVVEDRVEGWEIARIRIEPSVHVLGLDIGDRAVVAGGGNCGFGFVGDCGKRQQVGFDSIEIRRRRLMRLTGSQL